jgi:hypothetical protein
MTGVFVNTVSGGSSKALRRTIHPKWLRLQWTHLPAGQFMTG